MTTNELGKSFETCMHRDACARIAPSPFADLALFELIDECSKVELLRIAQARWNQTVITCRGVKQRGQFRFLCLGQNAAQRTEQCQGSGILGDRRGVICSDQLRK